MKMRFFLIFLLVSFYASNAYSEELNSGFRVGYDFLGSVEVDYITKDGAIGKSHSGWYGANLGNIYLSGLFYPNYIIGGFGWGIKYGYKSFKNSRQRFNLDNNTTISSGNKIWYADGDIGSEIEGSMSYVVPSIYYHFFKESDISLIIGFGMGFAYVDAVGSIYITDKFADSDADVSVCKNYLNSNSSYGDTSAFCEKQEINQRITT